MKRYNSQLINMYLFSFKISKKNFRLLFINNNIVFSNVHMTKKMQRKLSTKIYL